jgi:hypothetical protein
MESECPKTLSTSFLYFRVPALILTRAPSARMKCSASKPIADGSVGRNSAVAPRPVATGQSRTFETRANMSLRHD